MAYVPKPQALESLITDLYRNVVDQNLRTWRGWLRGQNEMGEELRRRFNAANFDEAQIAVIWQLLHASADYEMSVLLDFLEHQTTSRRMEIRLLSQGGEEVDYCIAGGEELMARFGDWGGHVGEVSDDWTVEQSREPDRRR